MSDDVKFNEIAAQRAAIIDNYRTSGSFRELRTQSLGKALLAAIAANGQAHQAWIAARRMTCLSPQDRLEWAIDALAVCGELNNDQPAAVDLVTQIKQIAEGNGEQALWDSWAAGTHLIGISMDAEHRALLLVELRDAMTAHGSPALREAFASAITHDLKHLKNDSALVALAELRALADDHPEPALLKAWAFAVYSLYVRRDPRARKLSEPFLPQLEALASRDPDCWRIWANTIWHRLEVDRDYVETDIARARADLAATRPQPGNTGRRGWPRAAAAVHHVLVTNDLVAAAALRAELKAAAAESGNREDLGHWFDACVAEITALRLTNYAAARSLYAELRAHAAGANDDGIKYDSKHALQRARDLVEDHDVKLSHGLARELLQPLDLTPLATETGDDLHVSRLDASHAPDLTTVGHRIRCRDMILANTAIEEIPDDVQVTQHLDVSNCRNLKRLPRGLKVGRLTARTCLALETLPDGLNVGYLDLTGCTALRALPADLVVRHGALTLRGCLQIRALPGSIRQIAHLDISGCPAITSVPPSLMVTASIDVGGSGLTSMPRHLSDVPIRWYGVPVDERIAFRPETLDVQEILGEHNAELRRVMMERFGFEQFMTKAKAEVLDRDRDSGGPRSLLRVAVPNDEPLVCVSVICPSTKRQFMLRVPPTMRSCRQAIAWTAGYDNPDDYQPMVET